MELAMTAREMIEIFLMELPDKPLDLSCYDDVREEPRGFNVVPSSYYGKFNIVPIKEENGTVIGYAHWNNEK